MDGLESRPDGVRVELGSAGGEAGEEGGPLLEGGEAAEAEVSSTLKFELIFYTFFKNV